MTDEITNLNQHLLQLVTEACQHPPEHRVRQRNLTRVIRLVSPRLWKEYVPYYPDALQQTWLFFAKNICTKYDSTLGGIPVWLNTHLKWRLRDFYLKEQTTRQNEISAWQDQDGEVVNVADHIPAPDSSILDGEKPLWEKVREWAETNEELQQLHVDKHPEITARLLILRRLPPETKWQALAKEFGVVVPTLSSFYRRECKPRLQQFGESEGYDLQKPAKSKLKKPAKSK
jgi:hypothetical protein